MELLGIKNLKAIDLHVHIGPEPIERKYSAEGLSRLAAESGTVFATKNHFFPTAYLAKGFFGLLGSIVLNESVGGLNPSAIYSSACVSEGPLVVWMPTISATTNRSPGLVPKEWGRTSLPEMRGSFGRKISPLMNGRLSEIAKETVRAVFETGAILATGHLSFQEAREVIEFASDLGVRGLVATHPTYGPQDYPIDGIRELSKKCFIEVAASMETIDGIPIGELSSLLRAVGRKRCILTSDYGQVKSPDPVSGLASFGRRLGLSSKSFRALTFENPLKIIKGGAGR